MEACVLETSDKVGKEEKCSCHLLEKLKLTMCEKKKKYKNKPWIGCLSKACLLFFSHIHLMLIVATVKYITAFVKIKPILISWEDHPGRSIVEYDCTGIQLSSVTQSCRTLCDPMNCSTPGLPVHHQLPEFTQTHVHRVCDAIQTSHPLSSPSPPAPNPSQHQSLFQWVNSLHEVAKVLEFQL